MADEFTEVTTVSWGSAIIDSFKGMIFGLVLFIASFIALSWNEGRSVHRIRTLAEGRGLVVSVDSAQVNPANNDKLVHLSGNATTTDVLQDPFFGVKANALKLQRVVEMYQWEEKTSSHTEKNLGGSHTTTKTYSYEKVWADHLIDSSHFNQSADHQNPQSMTYNGEIFTANVHVGALALGNELSSQLSDFKSYPISDDAVQAMHPSLKPYFQRVGAQYYYGDPNNPNIGAIRIGFKSVEPTIVSVVGRQHDSTLSAYTTKNGNIALLQTGNVPADSMFQAAENENTLITWVVRVVGWLAMWFGLSLLFGPIKALADVLPFAGSIVGAGIGFITGLVSFALSATTIAIAWIAYRPLIGGGLLLLVAGAVYMLHRRVRDRKVSTPQETTAAAPIPPTETH